MKKLIALMATLLLALSMVACGGEDSKESTTTEGKQNVEDSGKETKNEKDESEDVTTEKDKSTEEGKKMFDYEELSVSLTSFKIEESDGVYAYFDYANTGKTDYEVYMKYVVVNGIQIENDCIFANVYEETSKSTYQKFRMDTLEFYGITDVQNVAMMFSVKVDDEELYCTDLIYIYGDKSYEQVLEGTELLNENGIRMYVTEVFESSNGPSLKICVENNKDEDIKCVNVTETGKTLANGVEVNDALYCTVAANCKIVIHYYINGSSRRELGIETWADIQTLQFYIDVCKLDYKDESDMILKDQPVSIEIQDGKVVVK